MSPFFSIIIPVYNGEDFLEECLDSIITQDFSSYEVICIDDGSTDGSTNILKEYAKKYAPIVVRTIKNSGTAVARNEGIKMSKGHYLLFVDSDDWIDTNTLSTLYHYLLRDPVDILSFNGYLYHEKIQITELDLGDTIPPINGWDYYNQAVMRPRKFHFDCVVIRAYKKSFILSQGMFFHPGILHEDTLYTPVAFFRADRAAEIPNNLYYYRLREGSKMHTFNFKQIQDSCNVLNLLADFFITEMKLKEGKIFQIIASGYISLYSNKIKKHLGRKQKLITNDINKDSFKYSCKTYRHKIFYQLIIMHPFLYRFYIEIFSAIRLK